MIDPVALGYAGNAALGLFLVTTALVVVRRLRLGGRRELAIYLALVGANYVLDASAHVARTTGGDSSPWIQAAFLIGLLDPPFLFLFAVAVHGRRLPRWVEVSVLAPSVFLLLAALAARVELLPAQNLAGPYSLILVASYAGALVLLAQAHHAARTPAERELRAALVVAFSVIVLPRLPLLWADLGPAQGAGRKALISLAWFEGTFALVLTLAVIVLVATARADARASAWRIVRASIPLLAIVEALWLTRFLPAIGASAFALLYSGRWFVFAAVFAFGIREHEVLGIPTALGARTRAASAALLVLVVLLVTTGLYGAYPGAQLATALLSGALTTGLLVGAVAFAQRRASVGLDESRWRRLRIYRAHVELGADAKELAPLRRDLGLTDAEAGEEERLVALERATSSAGFGRPEVGATFAGRYEVRRVLGAGAVGLVYEARDRLTGDALVLKELRPDWRADAEAVRRLRREAELALRVSSPHVVSLVALERAEDGHVLVMERVEGETLRARLSRGPLALASVRRVGADMLEGVAALHRVGVLHRDIKPENIILRPDGGAVLVDLGAATGDGGFQTRVGGDAPGTPAYMSPEQRRDERIGAASDLYAAGVVLWECCAGALPPAGTPPAPWRAFLERALAEDPARRWPSASAMRAELPGP